MKTVKNVILLSLIFCTLSQMALASTTYTVTKIDDTNDGTCDSDCSLREAITAANNNSGADIIELEGGLTYSLTLPGSDDNNDSGDLDVLNDGLTIRTGSGTGLAIIDASAVSDRVFDVLYDATSTTFSLDHVQIQGGSLVIDSSNDYGAAIKMKAGTLNLTDCVVTDNTVTSTGTGSGTIIGGVIGFSQNTTNGLSLTNTSITSNNITMSGSKSINGGLIYPGDNFDSVSVTNSSVSDNTISGSVHVVGGMLLLRRSLAGTSTVSITNSQFNNNDITGGSSPQGGGVYAKDVDLSLTNSLFFNNQITVSNGLILGGLVYFDSVLTNHLTILNSTFGENNISAVAGTPNLLGGVFLINGENITAVSYSTFANNSLGDLSFANSVSGAVFYFSNSGGSITLGSNIIANNTVQAVNSLNAVGENCYQQNESVTPTSADYNVIDNTTDCGFTSLADHDFEGDPLLDAFASNGGDSQTYGLLAGSPALDLNSNCTDASLSVVNTDQRGAPRGADGGCDAGAYEKGTFYLDADEDGYVGASQYFPDNGLTSGDDCDDTNSAINPVAIEVCDGVDNNCNDTIDEGVQTTYYQDSDNDGFGDLNVPTTACTQPVGSVTNHTDNDDNDNTIYPSAPELCDGKDNDQNGTIDDGFQIDETCSVGVGLCAAEGTYQCVDTATSACNATVGTATTEVCGDDIDQDCNGSDLSCTCGDGVVTSPEACDDGANNSDTTADACRSDCTKATCGDGVVDTGEECDDSGASATCSAECKTITPTKTKKKSSGGCSLTAGPVLRSFSEAGASTEDAILFLLFVPMMLVFGMRHKKYSV